MGGELGSLVASLLEQEPWVGSLCGIDVDPPRRRLRTAQFHRIEPSDRERIVDVVTTFDPHVLIHLAVWEPDARAGTVNSNRASHRACANTARRPYASLPGFATIRCATSFWNMSVMSPRHASAFSHFTSSGVPTL